MSQVAVDGTFTEFTGHTTTSFEDFLAAIGQDSEAPTERTEVDTSDETTESYDSETEFNDMFGEKDSEDESEEESEETEEGDEEETEESDESSEESEQEEEEVDFGELEIDMDSEIQVGEEFITVSDLIKNRMAKEEIETVKAELETKSKEVAEKSAEIVTVLEKAKLECDKVIDDYKEFDWKKMASEDSKAYAEHREFLEAYLARKQEIDTDYAKAKEAQEAIVVAQKTAAADACVKTLKSDLPGWSDEVYQNTMAYAIEKLGMSQEFVTASVDAGFFKAVVSIMKRDADLKTAVTKVRKPTVKKVAKASGNKAAVKKSQPKKATASDVGISSYDVDSWSDFSKLGL